MWGRRSKVTRIGSLWPRFWLQFSGLGPIGRLVTRLAIIGAPPHSARKYLAGLTAQGFISPDADVYHADVTVGSHVFVDDRALIFQGDGGGRVELGDRVSLYRDVILQTGLGGSITIGARTGVHPGCQIMALVAPISIGCGVGIGAGSALYSYDHGMTPEQDIFEQALQSKGPIKIGDGAWLGTRVIVLSGVTIGKGAVIGAGSVVTHDIPERAIAMGTPARVVKMREEVVMEGLGNG